MENRDRKLKVLQLDKKLQKLVVLKNVERPSRGWINAVRTTLNMSLAQLGRRLKKIPATVAEIEEREMNNSITLKKLIEAGEALDLQFVYGFLPKELSLEKIIEKRAERKAREIVMRTSQSMKLEEQENSTERQQQAIKERTEDLKREMPKYLWD